MIWYSDPHCIKLYSIGYLQLARLEVKAQWVKEEPYNCENLVSDVDPVSVIFLSKIKH